MASNRLNNMDFIRELTQLEKLDVSNNMIETISSLDNPLSRLVSLKRLNLSGNRIKSIETETFMHLRQTIEYLNLADNPLNEVDLGQFKHSSCLLKATLVI